MHAFDTTQHLVKYNSAEEILQAHFQVRLEGYQARKKFLLDSMTKEHTISRNRARFVDELSTGKIEMTNAGRPQPRQYLVKALHEGGYDLVEDAGGDLSYKYLLSLPIDSLVADESQRLQEAAASLGEKLETLRNTPPEQMWMDDLDVLEKELLLDPLFAAGYSPES